MRIYKYVGELFEPWMLPKCSMKLRSSKFLLEFLIDNKFVMFDGSFFKRQSVLFWLPTVLLLDLTKYLCYVYVCAMYVDRAVEKNDNCCFKSSTNTCMLDLQENENENIFIFFLYEIHSVVFYKVVQAIYHRIIFSSI